MAKYSGKVGFVKMEETAPGVYTETIEERTCYGDVTKNSRRYEGSQNLNDNLNLNNTISIVADAYAKQNYFAIRYVKWMGCAWKVTNVDV